MQLKNMKVATSLAALLVGGFSSAVTAQESAQNSEGMEFEEIVVVGSSSRLPEELDSFPGSVTVIDQKLLDDMRKSNGDIALILGQLVPGLGAGTSGTTSNFEQSLRGRKPAILIDGIPVGTPLRDGRHDVRSLSASTIGSVEVIRGSSALYGNGGAGGVINYITKRAEEDETRIHAEVGTSFSFTHFGDSLAPYVDLSAVGKTGNVDFNAAAFVEKTGGQFDADGDRIHPDPNGQGGAADSETYNLFLKVGSTFGEQRIEFSALYYKQEQDSEFNTRINGDVAAGIKTTAARGELDERATPTGNSNLLLSGLYSNEDLMGSSLSLRAFYQDYENIFGFSDFFPEDGQSVINSSKHGVRLDINTPITDSGANVLWGVDYTSDQTAQVVWNNGLGDRSIRVWAPEVTQDSFAGFAQFSVPVGDMITLQGGVRHESIDISFPGFTAIFSGVDVQAGEASYSATTINVGGNVDITEWLGIYGAYSEGFSTAEVGRVLRQADENTDFANSEIEASVVKNYEIGARFDFGDYRASVAAYRAKSNLGTSITSDLQISRAPEKTYGVEVTFDANPMEELSFGGSLTYSQGEKDTDGDDVFDRFLGSNRTGPVKVTGYVAYDVTENLSTRMNVLYSAVRDPFKNNKGFAEARVEAYTVVDFSASYSLETAGAFTLGVQNLLNADYFSLGSQFFNRNDRYSKAPGRVVKLSYAMDF